MVVSFSVGFGYAFPVIVLRGLGGIFHPVKDTAARSNKGKSYVAIADHINSFNTFKDYTTGTKYDTLAEAYAAYKEQVENDVRFQPYKNTLPE